LEFRQKKPEGGTERLKHLTVGLRREMRSDAVAAVEQTEIVRGEKICRGAAGILTVEVNVSTDRMFRIRIQERMRGLRSDLIEMGA